MNELLYSGLVSAGFTLAILFAFVVLYWAFRGFLPGSRVVELPLVAPNGMDTNSATFKIFHVKWCPYSREAVEKVKQLQAFIDENGYKYGGKTIKIEYVDCESKKSECSTYSVEAYPTYKLETSAKMYEYLGPPDLSTYRTFFVSALGKESAT
jgi:hypothetical protein